MKQASRKSGLIRLDKETKQAADNLMKDSLAIASLSPEEALSRLDTSPDGLDEERVENSREEHGENTVAQSHGKSWPMRLLSSFATPFTLLLLVVAIISVVIELLPDSNGQMGIVTDSSWWVTPLIIVVMVIFSGLVSFVENSKSQHSSEKLRQFTENTSTVIREGKRSELPNSETVVGDVISLGAGDMIPADCRIIDARDLFLDQSALNGESAPAEKTGAPYSGTPDSMFDIPDIAYSGSSVVSGMGKAVIFRVGSETVLGRLAKWITQKKGKTSFEREMSSITKLLMCLTAVMVPLIFVLRGLALNGLTDISTWLETISSAENWLVALSFSVSVAVGLIPALLPMQVASNLAKGAVNMSRKDVIVKDINSIQNFGSMDVLCTDKTGTLTEGNSTVSDFIDYREDSREELIDLAFLNSRFQTGIRNQLDRSIIEYLDTKPDDEQRLLDRYSRLDEIPFDFNRKMLSILVKDSQNGDNILVTKGFSGTVKDRIGYVYDAGNIIPAGKEEIDRIKRTVEKYASLGTRVILLAAKRIEGESVSPEDESDLCFLGYLTFKDAPKESAARAIQELWSKGVRVKVLTGDSLAGSLALLKATGFGEVQSLSGPRMAFLDDEQLAREVERCDLFVKLSPEDKERIVTALKGNGHAVGFMGDGINDAAALRAADVGISFKDATDIAKEAADVILLENDLDVLIDGIDEGRKACINMMKYIKIQTSSNFGNMVSQLVGAIWIPFIPMAPVQIILLDLITDISCACMPFDSVDPKAVEKPLRFDMGEIRWFMFTFGPVSSLVDLAAFALLLYYIAPAGQYLGGTLGAYQASWAVSDPERLTAFTAVFQTGFFLESLVTQNIVYAILRTDRVPFVQSRPSLTFGFSILLSVLIGFLVIYVPDIQSVFDFASEPDLPWRFIPILLGFVVAYLLIVQGVKPLYKRKFGHVI